MNRLRLIAVLEGLETYAKAGLSLSEALSAMAGSMPREAARLSQAVTTIESGGKLSTMLGVWGAPQMVTSIIECGEESGTLSESLKRSRELLSGSRDLSQKCLSALLYPVAIGVFTTALAAGLVQGVFPQIVPLLYGLHAELPLITRIMIFLSANIAAYWAYASILSALLAIVFIMIYRRSHKFKWLCHVCIMKTPVAGAMIARHSLAAFFESFGSMVESGMPMHMAYKKAVAVMPLLPMRDRFEREEQPLIRGEPLYSLLGRMPHVMPPYAVSLVRAGELSGSLGRSSRRVGEMISSDLAHTMKRSTAILEPALMIGMGCVVGSVALSIMMPIYGISKALQH